MLSADFLSMMTYYSSLTENEVYYYHGNLCGSRAQSQACLSYAEMQQSVRSKHLGGANWITDVSGHPVQHLQYLPFGEPFVNQHPTSYQERFTFTGKERDKETGYGYFGARYMDHELMTGWLSVDPMSDKYPSISPYNYCMWNPVKLVDPDGKEINPVYTREGQYLGNTKEGFTGDPLIMNKNDYETMMGVSGVTNISELCVDDVQTYGGTTFDDVIGRDAISGDAQVEVIKNIISQYDDPDLTNRFGFNASNLASRIGYDKDGKMVGPNANFVTVTDKKENIPAMFYFWRGHSSYELTVENITASLVYHEWLGHEIMGWGEGDNPMRRASSGGTHYACYLSVMISPIYKKTTPAYQKFNEDAFKYLFK